MGLMSVLVTQGHQQEQPGWGHPMHTLDSSLHFASEATEELSSSRKLYFVVLGLLLPGGRCTGLGLSGWYP